MYIMFACHNPQREHAAMRKNKDRIDKWTIIYFGETPSLSQPKFNEEVIFL